MSKKYKVVITDFITEPLEPENQILGDLSDVIALDGSREQDLAGKIEDADAIMLYHILGLTHKTIEQLNRCKLIVRCGVGYDNIDHALARRRGIPVANVPDYGTEEVADSAIGLMMAMIRGITRINSLLREAIGPWMYTQVVPLHRLRGRVFGIVGLGRIGTAAALRAKALGMDVVFYDPYKPCGYEKAVGVRRVEHVDELFAQSHVLSLHCPLTEETFHLIDRRTIATLPAGAYLINTARGAVVDATSLPEALASGQLAGAGIDVLEQEPPPADHPLIVAWRDPNHAAHHRLIINPHLAFYSEEGLMDMRTKGSIACRKALCGQPIPNVVN
ncbi:MAG: C-terminal binding protein [Planctomycetes bacterium]|nr:C-terminal binding protein [Planctomycetota bacterium]MBU4400559.1 C-terminal binding protein [Planctomycetota bacterium]MCG2685179.1 C-terminal binding protein [Planctomycetales bacterium]